MRTSEKLQPDKLMKLADRGGRGTTSILSAPAGARSLCDIRSVGRLDKTIGHAQHQITRDERIYSVNVKR